MDELKRTLDAAIDDRGVDGVLEALADVINDRVKATRDVDWKRRWKAALVAVDNARLETDL